MFSQQAHAPPPACGRWRRQRAKRAWAQHLVKKAPFFLLRCDNFCNKLGTKNFPCFFFFFYIESSSKFCCYVTIFVTHWTQKTSLAFSSFSILSQPKILLLCDKFCNRLGTKNFPCFFFFFYIESAQNSAAM